MANETTHWESKTIFLRGYAEDIIRKQEEINCSNNMFVIATQMFPLKNDEKAILYECFIYYKVNPNSIKIPNDIAEAIRKGMEAVKKS